MSMRRLGMVVNPLRPAAPPGAPGTTPMSVPSPNVAPPLPAPPPGAPQQPVLAPPGISGQPPPGPGMPLPTGPMVNPMPGGLPPQMPGLPHTMPTPGQPGQKFDLRGALQAAGINLPPEDALKQIDLGRRSPRGKAAADGLYERVAQDLSDWLNTMPQILATAIRGGPHQQGPFKHAATGRQKFEVYKAKLFNQDGTPNLPGRQQLLQRSTPRQYAEIVHIVTGQMKRDKGFITAPGLPKHLVTNGPQMPPEQEAEPAEGEE